ncbi:MAG: MFS transporter [Coprococcus sp.]|nr:MFS transporter [Coprococcus sp.]
MKKFFHYAWVVCIGCAFICALTSPIINATATQYLISVTEEFGVSRSAFTLSSTLVALVGVFVSPVWGKIYSNKKQFKLIFTGTALGFALAYMSYSLAHSIIQFYVSAVILGFFWAGACFMPVSMIITAWFDKMRGLAMSITLAGIGFGGSILAPIINQFITSYGWRTTYRYVGIIIMVIACPVIFFILKPTPESMGLKPFGADQDMEEKAKKKTVISNEGNLDLSFEESKGKMFFWLNMLGFLGMGLVCSAPMRQMNPYISDIYGPAFAASVISISSLGGVFGKILLGWLHDKIGNLRSASIAFLAFAFAFIFALMGASNSDMLYVYIILYSFAAGVGTVSAPLLISATFGTKNFNIMRGITQTPLQAGMSLGGLMVSGIFDITGAYSFGWIACAVISVLSIFCFYASHSMSRKMRSAKS